MYSGSFREANVNSLSACKSTFASAKRRDPSPVPQIGQARAASVNVTIDQPWGTRLDRILGASRAARPGSGRDDRRQILKILEFVHFNKTINFNIYYIFR